MPDKMETELKFVVPDPGAMRVLLLRLGAQTHGLHVEDNIRLDDPQRGLSARQVVLRLRQVSVDEGTARAVLTVKAPGDVGDAFKSRHEVETEVGDPQAMLSALWLLGFEPYWRYEKRREVFTLDGVEADLDELPYGWFLELEGPEAGIRALAGKLGLDVSQGLVISYAEIFRNVRSGMGLDVRDLTFAAFEGIVVDPSFYYP